MINAEAEEAHEHRNAAMHVPSLISPFAPPQSTSSDSDAAVCAAAREDGRGPSRVLFLDRAIADLINEAPGHPGEVSPKEAIAPRHHPTPLPGGRDARREDSRAHVVEGRALLSGEQQHCTRQGNCRRDHCSDQFPFIFLFSFTVLFSIAFHYLLSGLLSFLFETVRIAFRICSGN